MSHFDPTISSLSENPDDAAKKREANEAFDLAGENTDYGASAEEFKLSFGIGQNRPEDAGKVAGKVAEAEAGEGEPDIDLSAFDGSNTIYGEDGREEILGNSGNDSVTIKKEGVQEGNGYEASPDKEGIEKPNPTEIQAGNGETKVDKISEDGNIEEARKQAEHPMTPSVKHLKKSKKIDVEQEAKLIEHFSNNGSIDDIGTLKSIREAKNLEEIKGLLRSMTETQESPEDNIKKFTEACGNDLGIKRDEKGKFENITDEDAINLLGSNFHLINTGDKNEDTKNALDTAFASAHNNLIDGKQFPRDITYEENSKRVLAVDITPKERFEAFQTNMLHVETHQALGGKKDKAFAQGAEEKLELAGVQEEFYATLAEFQKEPEGPRQIELAQELENLRVEAKLTEGEASLLVGGGELDKVSDALGESTPQTA